MSGLGGVAPHPLPFPRRTKFNIPLLQTVDEVQHSGLKTNERIRCQCDKVDRLSTELRLIGQLVKVNINYISLESEREKKHR